MLFVYWGLFPGGKAAEEWTFPQSSVDVKNECVELYLYSPICLRGVDMEKL